MLENILTKVDLRKTYQYRDTVMIKNFIGKKLFLNLKASNNIISNDINNTQNCENMITTYVIEFNGMSLMKYSVPQ